MTDLNVYLMDVYRSVDTSKRLEKMAGYFDDDEEVKQAALGAKAKVDAEIFDLVKRASLKSELARKALTGLAYGTAPIAGAGVLGYGLLSKAKRDAAETAADIRNKVLQTALGLGGIGAGLYGLHRLTGGEPIEVNKLLSKLPRKEVQEKTSSDRQAEFEELLTKLAAVGKIEDDLANLDFEQLSPDAQKLACELRALNQGYGVQLLYEASHSKES